MTTPARRAALDPLLNWMADRILEQLLAEAATASQTHISTENQSRARTPDGKIAVLKTAAHYRDHMEQL